MKNLMSALFLALTFFSITLSVNTMAQNSAEPDPSFFGRDPGLNARESRREIYKDARGSYLSDENQSNVSPDSLASNYSEEFSFIRTMKMLQNQLNSDSGRHYIFLNISDGEFLEFSGYLNEFLTSVDSFQADKISNIYKLIETNNNYNLDDFHIKYSHALTTVDEKQVSAIDQFVFTIGLEMGEDVVNQIYRLVERFSTTASFSMKVGIITAASGKNLSEEESINTICE